MERALTALERHRRHLVAGRTILVPAVVAARVVRNPAGQVRLMRALSACELVPFEARYHVPVGRLLAAAGTSDVINALVAAEADAAVITSDAGGMSRLLQTLGARGPALPA